MKELILYTLACFGLAYVIGYSKISLPFRLVLEPENDRQVFRAWVTMLIECPACLGFWFGLAYGAFTMNTFDFPLPGWAGVIGLALYTCAANFLLAMWTVGIVPEEYAQEGAADDEAG